MKKTLEPLRKRRDDLLHTIQTEAETLQKQIDLPELPEPEVEPDDEGWLYDSSRDYLEQLEAYKAHKYGNGDDSPEGSDEDDEEDVAA